MKCKILIVDDEPLSRKFVAKYLNEPGWELVLAGSGQQCLDLLLENDIDIVLLDVNMPGMDGYDTAAQMKIREETADIPIIFLTAESKDDFYKGKGFEIGGTDYIIKPADPKILRRKVHALASMYHKLKELKRQIALKKESEDALSLLQSESEDRFQLCLSLLSGAFILLDNRLNIIDNRGLAELLGYADKTLRDKTLKGLCPEEGLLALSESIAEARKTKSSPEIEFYINGSSGESKAAQIKLTTTSSAAAIQWV